MSDVQTVAPTTLALTVQEAKRQLNLSTTDDDVLLEGQIKAATLLLENRCNRCFVNQTRALKMRTFLDSRYVHDRAIQPPRSPLNSTGLSIAYVATDGTTTTLASSDYRVGTGDFPGNISEEYGATWPNTRNVMNDVTVTYIAGHSTAATGIPWHIKQAIGMVVAHWYRNREAVFTGSITKEIELGVD